MRAEERKEKKPKQQLERKKAKRPEKSTGNKSNEQMPKEKQKNVIFKISPRHFLFTFSLCLNFMFRLGRRVFFSLCAVAVVCFDCLFFFIFLLVCSFNGKLLNLFSKHITILGGWNVLTIFHSRDFYFCFFSSFISLCLFVCVHTFSFWLCDIFYACTVWNGWLSLRRGGVRERPREEGCTTRNILNVHRVTKDNNQIVLSFKYYHS